MLVEQSRSTRIPKEAFIWVLALVVLYFINTEGSTHFSLCLLHNLGFDWCPGCGIGRSISCVMHGNLQEAWEFHKLGIIALPIILFRIFQLIYKTTKT